MIGTWCLVSRWCEPYIGEPVRMYYSYGQVRKEIKSGYFLVKVFSTDAHSIDARPETCNKVYSIEDFRSLLLFETEDELRVYLTHDSEEARK